MFYSIRFLLLGVIFISYQITQAQNFVVTTTSDAVDANIGDGTCDDGAGNCSLRAAIQESNALGGSHTITLAAATYTLTIAGANENGSATGDLDISSTITLNGVSAQTTLIDANGLDRVMQILNTGTLTASNISFTSGSITENYGGGILNKGTFTFSNGEIYSNTAKLLDGTTSLYGGFGGGLANFNTATLTNVTIRTNYAYGSEGPQGINGGGGGGSTPGFGGAIYNSATGVLVITNSTLSGNMAVGGLGSRGMANNGNSTWAGSSGGGDSPGTGGTTTGNPGTNATGEYSGGGGGSSEWTNGGSGGDGGYGAGGGAVGAKAGSGSSANAAGLGGFGGGNGGNGCCSSGGGGGAGAGFGGGIFNNGGDITITNSTIAYNQALGGGGSGGLYGWAQRGLRGTGLGGGLFNRTGTININNTLISNNNATQANGTYTALDTIYGDLSGTFTSNTGYNLIYTPGTAIIGGTTTGNITGADPLLLSLGFWGGSTFTHALKDCTTPSPAIDAGLDAAAPTLDQIGVARYDVTTIAGTNISDIGSFESVCYVLPVELLEFNAKCEKGHVKLIWSTSSEVNNAFFTIEKSDDGIHFETINNIGGNGNSKHHIDYEWIDFANSNLTQYYRLKQTDNNGDFEYLGIRTANCYNKSQINVYPNPTSGNFTINLGQTYNQIDVKIKNVLGQTISNSSHTSLEQIVLSVLDKNGLYFVEIRIDNNVEVFRILKK